MRPLPRIASFVLFAAVLAAALVACKHTIGPSLSVSIEGRRLEPSSTVQNAAGICCCRVRGNVRNDSSVAVNVELRFYAKDASGKDLGTGLDWVKNVAPGGSLPFDAAGITAVCSQVATVTNDPLAYGLYDVPK